MSNPSKSYTEKCTCGHCKDDHETSDAKRDYCWGCACDKFDPSQQPSEVEEQIDEILGMRVAHAVMESQGFHGGLSQAQAKQKFLQLLATEVEKVLDRLVNNSNLYDERTLEREPFYAVWKSEVDQEQNKLKGERSEL